MLMEWNFSPTPADWARQGEWNWEPEQTLVRGGVLDPRSPTRQSDLPGAAARRCCCEWCELCDVLRCAMDAMNATTMNAISVGAMQLRLRAREQV